MSIYIAKVFMDGRSQAIRLPKLLRFDCDEVYIRKRGDSLIISSKLTSWDDFFEQTSAFHADFLIDQKDSLPQDREYF